MPKVFDKTVTLASMICERLGLVARSAPDSSLGHYRLFTTLKKSKAQKCREWNWPHWMVHLVKEDCVPHFESIDDTVLRVPESEWEEWYPRVQDVAVEFESLTGLEVQIHKTRGFVQFSEW